MSWTRRWVAQPHKTKATSAASSKAALALRSEAITGAPERNGTPMTDRNRLIKTASVISVSGNAFLAVAKIAIGIIAYFWWRNTQGIRESSHDALRIVGITTVMVVILLLWAAATLLMRGGHLAPAPVPGGGK